MKHLVINLFADRESGKLFSSGSYFISEDYERIQCLSSLGFIVPNSKTEDLNTRNKIKESKITTKSRKIKAADENVTES